MEARSRRKSGKRRKSTSRKRRRRSSPAAAEESPRPASATNATAASTETHVIGAPALPGSSGLPGLAAAREPLAVTLSNGHEAALTASEAVRCVAVAAVMVSTVRATGSDRTVPLLAR